MLNTFWNFMTSNKIVQLLCPCLLLLFWIFLTNNYANEHSERDNPLTSRETMLSTSDLLEIWINLNINVTNLNSLWNFMMGNKKKRDC